MKSHLRTVIVGIGVLSIVACASGPDTKPESKLPTAKAPAAEPKVDNSGFTNGVAALSGRTGRVSAADCLKSPKTSKALNWKDLVRGANGCVMAKDWRRVEELAAILSTEHHLSPWGPYYMSLAAESRRDFDRALWMIELALKKSPKVGLLYYQKGRVLWATESFSEAVSHFQSAVELDPKLTDAHLILGEVFYRDQDLNLAGKHMAAVLEAEPRNVSALVVMATVHTRKNEYLQAVDMWERAIRETPASLDFRLRQADLLENQQKDVGRALDAYKKIRSLWQDKRLQGQLTFSLEDKIKILEVSASKTTPGEKLSLREPAEDTKKVAK